MSESRNRWKTLALESWKRPEALVGLCILIAYLLVWPVGDYVIEDDWAFSLTLRNLHESGKVQILDWIPMTLVTHLFTGLLFTKVLGFHLTLLKITTVLLLAVEAWAVMALLRRLGVGEAIIAMAGLTLVFNPLHFFQSFLYATDIPALAWSSLALLFYARGLEDSGGRLRWFWFGSVFASLAWGVRQSAVLVVGALFVYLLLCERRRLKSLHLWAASFLLPALSIVGFQVWYQNVHGPTGSYLQYRGSITQALGGISVLGSAETVFLLAIYAAFCVLPMALAFRSSGRRGLRSPGVLAATVMSTFLAGMFLWATFGRAVRFPYLRNKITQFGFLSPNEIVLGAREVLWGSAVGWIVSGVLLVAAVVLGFQLTRGLVEKLWSRSHTIDDGQEGSASRQAVLRLVFLLFLLQGLYSFLTLPILFDRHLLILLPTALILLIALKGSQASFRRVVFVPCLLVLAGYSIAGAHDLHAISRTSFLAGETLIAEGVDAQFIDGGLAFDGWYMFERAQKELAAGHPPVRRVTPTVQDAWYIQNIMPRILTRYLVSLSPSMDTEKWEGALAPWAREAALGPRFEAHDVKVTYPYRTYWPWGVANLYVLEDRELALALDR